MTTIRTEVLPKHVQSLYSFFASSSKSKYKWDELPALVRATLKDLGVEKDIVSLSDVVRAIISKYPKAIKYDDIPPCIRRAVEKHDLDAVDEIFSFLRTYGKENADAILWSIGYYTLDTYKSRKMVVEGLISNAPLFKCPYEPPEVLSKYCTPELCFIRNPREHIKRLIKEVKFEDGAFRNTVTITVTLSTGHRVVLRNHVYFPWNTEPLWINVARHVRDKIIELLGWCGVSLEELKDYIRKQVLLYVGKKVLPSEDYEKLKKKFEEEEVVENV
jgi:hypothetical protein